MSIQSTQNITRERAIERIREVSECCNNHNYTHLSGISFETDADIINFINNGPWYDLTHIDKFTDHMIEDILDDPFYRFSLFENYTIVG